ncbi:MgtC/SapB family protein [Mariniflexile gromovii]|uniref:MgtC/SapB family protein n=1 Tax=Mariniflexile gromovii TaxID=362523 RepID=A0ABS4BSW5_9FLAO|nr:MgtC/SapB family protein [Mariniflexile gromovii]MBP0903160.1 MgtC/SapB family protein [Mariniflexile gromovii]
MNLNLIINPVLDFGNNTNLDFIISVFIAMVAGFCIGLERQMKNKNAGLKTYALVAVGSAVFTNISFQYLGLDYVDTARIISQIVVGVGFLGAGVIVQGKHKISGLATAATIWCSAGLGCLAALKMYTELLSVTIIIVIINTIFGFLNSKINKHTSNEANN